MESATLAWVSPVRRVFEDDRRCSRPDCTTRLCMYNAGPECYLHAFQTTTARLAREAVERDEMLELMERNYGIGDRVAA